MVSKHDKHDLMSILEEWEPSPDDTGLASRGASLLNYAAERKPGAPIPWSMMTKKILGISRMPGADTKVVIDMRKRASQIRIVLERDYKRGLDNIAGLGVRATFSDDDFANTTLTRAAKQHERSGRKLIEKRALVDPKKMKNKKLKTWVENLSPVLTSHNDRLLKLLLPPGEEKDDEESGKEGVKDGPKK